MEEEEDDDDDRRDVFWRRQTWHCYMFSAVCMLHAQEQFDGIGDHSFLT